MDQRTQPKLGKPGAGLPFFQAILAKYVFFPKFVRAHSWEQSLELFDRESEKILALISGRTPQELETKILVSGIRGIEDSSRFWSVAMTLEHLIIVGDQIAQAVVLLSKKEPLPRKADTAAVKPKGVLSAAELERDFRDFTVRYKSRVLNEVLDRDSTTTGEHPWFGEINAHAWNALTALHQGIHRRQIKAILKGLANHPK